MTNISQNTKDRIEANPYPLSIKGLDVSYPGGDDLAINNVDLSIEAGQRFAIIGPNGAGKSTLLNAALGLIPRDRGDITFFGEGLDKARPKIAYVPQRQNVDWDFPIDVQGVVSMALHHQLGLLGRFRAAHRDHVLHALERVQMADFAKRPIGALSGGQQQRAFLARALAQPEAELFMLDEPFAGVDSSTERIIADIFKDLASESKTVVAVHHNLSTARDYFTHAGLLNKTILQNGPISDILTQANIQQTYDIGL